MTAGIVGVASCPQPPLLLPGMTGRPVPEVERLRAACREAVADLVAGEPDELVLVGGLQADEVDRQGAPVSLRVGRLLLAEVDCAVPVQPLAIRADTPVEQCLCTGRRLAAEAVRTGRRLGLLVMADGSARRGPKAPGYLDPRALPFDQLVERALTAGDPAGLAALDEQLAADLLVAGRAAWQVLAGAAEGRRFGVRSYYSDDPFGVFYPVVGWQLTDNS